MEESERNKSFLELQGKWWRCNEADAQPVTISGRTYIEATGGRELDRKEPPRVLLTFKSEKFEPLCHIDQKVRYIGEEIKH